MGLNTLATLSTLFTSVLGDCDAAYEQFVVDQKKVASPESKDLFCERFEEMEEWNSQNSRWVKGLNQFSDLSGDDIALWLGDVDPAVDRLQLSQVPPANLSVTATDWRGNMPAVKNQGSCGSCWTFGAAAVVDFNRNSHAEQQIGDCSSSNMCNGGSATSALQYLTGAGSCSTSSYPYAAKAGSCQSCSAIAQVSNVRQISGHDAILSVVQSQVISLSFALSGSGPFMSYKSGVYNSACGTGSGHAVAAVGYNSDYWIIRNSWGSSWGQSGYFYFKKGTNLCDMETRRPVYASISGSFVV